MTINFKKTLNISTDVLFYDFNKNIFVNDCDIKINMNIPIYKIVVLGEGISKIIMQGEWVKLQCH